MHQFPSFLRSGMMDGKKLKRRNEADDYGVCRTERQR